jgi:hypothetical protein
VKKLVAALAVAAAGALAYDRLLRRRILDRGATSAEVEGRLPRDELLEDADGVATRAITIDSERPATTAV